MGEIKTSDIEINSEDTVRKLSSADKRLIFAIISMALLMHTIDSTIVATALHTLQEDLQTSVSWAGWTITGYSFGFVLMLPLSAKLSIRYGHKRIFLISVLTFTLASLLCGLANNIHMLITLRVFQAVGGAGITPSATGIIVEHFGKSRDRYVGLFGSIFATGAMIGPIFGGIFVTYWSWRGIFFINIPLGIAVTALALRFIPTDSILPSKREKLDFRGLLLMALAIISAMYAATYLGEKGNRILSTTFIGLGSFSILAFILLFRHLRRSNHPFIHPRFITGKGFGAVNFINILHSGMTIGAISLVPLYAVNRYGISELHSGTLLAGEGIASVILSTVMSIYLRRTGYRLPLYAGGTLVTLGIAILAIPPLFSLSAYMWLAGGTLLIGTGFGMMSPAGRNAGLQLAPDQSATIAAIRSLCMQLGGIISVAIATAIITGSSDSNQAHAMIYGGLAVMLALGLPMVSRIHENKGSW